jgi:succinate dehydrogenase/fumarate reductase-like Fe-S protein
LVAGLEWLAEAEEEQERGRNWNLENVEKQRFSNYAECIWLHSAKEECRAGERKRGFALPRLWGKKSSHHGFSAFYMF